MVIIPTHVNNTWDKIPRQDIFFHVNIWELYKKDAGEIAERKEMIDRIHELPLVHWMYYAKNSLNEWY